MDRGRFRHTTQVRVRNYEIDWQGVVHNANYLLYCETGRIAYIQDLGVPITVDSIQREAKIVIVRNEIDYFAPARLGDLLNILTRVSSIGNSSFAFEGIIEEASTGRKMAENVSVHVWLDPTTGRPMRVPDRFRNLVRQFEGQNLRSEGAGGAS